MLINLISDDNIPNDFYCNNNIISPKAKSIEIRKLIKDTCFKKTLFGKSVLKKNLTLADLPQRIKEDFDNKLCAITVRHKSDFIDICDEFYAMETEGEDIKEKPDPNEAKKRCEKKVMDSLSKLKAETVWKIICLGFIN